MVVFRGKSVSEWVSHMASIASHDAKNSELISVIKLKVGVDGSSFLVYGWKQKRSQLETKYSLADPRVRVLDPPWRSHRLTLGINITPIIFDTKRTTNLNACLWPINKQQHIYFKMSFYELAVRFSGHIFTLHNVKYKFEIMFVIGKIKHYSFPRGHGLLNRLTLFTSCQFHVAKKP